MLARCQNYPFLNKIALQWENSFNAEGQTILLTNVLSRVNKLNRDMK